MHSLVRRESPLQLAELRAACERGAAGLVRLRRAVKDGGLPSTGSGLGRLLDDAVSLRSAASMTVAFIGVRRASEVAQLLRGDMSVDLTAGVVDLEVKRQTNDQFGVGQMGQMDSWGAPCHARILSG